MRSLAIAACHWPFCLASATFSRPALVIMPSRVNRSTRLMLVIDQMLPARRGVKRSMKRELSRVLDR